MAPGYLQSQIDRSLEDMHLDSIDVYYIHNPESQLGAIESSAFELRLAQAFEKLEENRANGKIQFYGAATWNGFRVAQQQQGFHSLEKMSNIAKQAGGENHGFRFIQLPFNLAMPEASLFQNQQLNGNVVSTFEAANQFGISVMCSASILQGKLAANLPAQLKEELGSPGTDALASIQFVRSTPNVTTALVGMSKAAHVEENLKLVNIEPVTAEDYKQLFTRE
jgi:aryl-alcohol dehydrogenase-like predicted oxidoreductase